MAALIAICSSVVFGVADFLGGMSARRIAPMLTAAGAQLTGLAVLLAAALATGGSPTGTDIALAAAAGLLGGAALAAFYFGLSQGAMSVVAPLSAITAAIVPILAGLVLGEAPGAPQWAGVVLALPAIVLISREGTSEPAHQAEEPVEERTTPEGNRVGVTAGLVAGLGFGMFIVLITRTSAASRWWPLVVSRSTAAVLLGAGILLAGAWRGRTDRTGLRLAGLAGLLDGTSNMLILEAGRRGMLVLVGVIGALYPASTIVLARVVLGERLQRHQLAGLALATVAVVMIAVPA